MSHHADEKWLMFKNFLHNELEVTKDDIQKWVKEAIREEARKVINQKMKENDKFDIDKVIEELIIGATSNWKDPRQFKAGIQDKVAELVAENLQIDLKLIKKDK